MPCFLLSPQFVLYLFLHSSQILRPKKLHTTIDAIVNHAVSPDRYILRTAETEIAVLFSVCLTHNTRLLSWLETFLTLYNFNKFVNQSVGRDV